MSKILLAEDDEMMRTFLAASLKRAGHEVQDFEDGETALNALEREVFDLLLTDIVMPGIDGIELARRGAELPVLVGHLPEAQLRQRARRAVAARPAAAGGDRPSR